jgi:hypothetical protein
MKRSWKIIAMAYVALALSPLVVFALFSVASFGWEVLGGHRDWLRRDAVTAPERAQELAKQGLVEQVITFRNGPTGLRKDPKTDEFDLYAISVGQTTLDEIRPTKMFNMLSGPPTPRSSLKYASSQPVVGQFNNLLIFEPKSGVTTQVFPARLAVSSFRYLAGPDFEVVMIFAADKDSDKDGVLSDADIQDVYIYAVKDRALHKVTGLSGNPAELYVLANQAYAIVRAVQDDNGDGSTTEMAYEDKAPEQSLLFRVDLRTYAAEPLMSDETLKSPQRTLEAASPIGAVPN